MKKTFLVTLVLALAAAGLAVAQEAGAPKPAKIAVIDMARVSAESQLGKRSRPSSRRWTRPSRRCRRSSRSRAPS